MTKHILKGPLPSANSSQFLQIYTLKGLHCSLVKITYFKDDPLKKELCLCVVLIP